MDNSWFNEENFKYFLDALEQSSLSLINLGIGILVLLGLCFGALCVLILCDFLKGR